MCLECAGEVEWRNRLKRRNNELDRNSLLTRAFNLTHVGREAQMGRLCEEVSTEVGLPY